MATCLSGLILAVPVAAIAAPQTNTAPLTFYERQLNKLAHPTGPNLRLPTFPSREDNPAEVAEPQPIQTIPETLTQPEEVALVKIRKIAPALSQLSNQLKSQLKQQIVLTIKPSKDGSLIDESLIDLERSHPDPYALIAAARNNQSPLKHKSLLISTTALSQPIGNINQQLNQRIDEAKGSLTVALSQRPQQIKDKLDQAKVDLKSRSSQQIGTYADKLQIAFDNTVKKPLRNLLKKIELAAHRNAEKLQ